MKPVTYTAAPTTGYTYDGVNRIATVDVRSSSLPLLSEPAVSSHLSPTFRPTSTKIERSKKAQLEHVANVKEKLMRGTGFFGWVGVAFAFLLATNGSADEVTEVTAKQRVSEYVRSRLSLDSDHFLRVIRREDLEDDLFAAQVKVRGEIHKAALLFEVTETGYEVRSPEEVIFHSSVDGASRWYVAIDALSGGIYGLGGFDESQRDFNKLASNAKVLLISHESARNWAAFYLTVGAGISREVFITRQSDLRRHVEDIAEAYSSSRKQPFSPEKWVQDLEKNGIEPLFGMEVRSGDGKFRVQVDAITSSIDRTPILQRLQFDVSPRGRIAGQSFRPLFPKN